MAEVEDTGVSAQPMDRGQLLMLVEALLFVADGPVQARELAQALQVSEEEVQVALKELQAASATRGIRLQHSAGRYQLVTAPEAGRYVEALLGLQATARLSSAAIETATIIAYRQPITRAQIEAVRGVDCDGVLRTLLARGLICEVGRLEQAGHPILYGTTFEFLRYFGINDLSELPRLEELDRGTTETT